MSASYEVALIVSIMAYEIHYHRIVLMYILLCLAPVRSINFGYSTLGRGPDEVVRARDQCLCPCRLFLHADTRLLS